MINNKKILAIIPARKGSKRLPFKNILDLNGKPLIAWTFEEVAKSNLIDRILVSTNDENIINLTKNYKVEAPFKRPVKLSGDKVSTYEVIIHAIDFYKSKNILFDYILLLQPTSPLRKCVDIDNAIKLLNKNTYAVVSVCETEHSPLWANSLPRNLSMKSFIKPEIKNKRSQDLPIYYRLNGAIYISEIEYFIKNNGFLGDKTKAYIMPKSRSIDIDTKIDFELCKIMMNENN